MTCTTCQKEIKGDTFTCTGNSKTECSDLFCSECAKHLLWNPRCPACDSIHNGMPRNKNGIYSWCRQECNCAEELKTTVICTKCAPKGKCTKCKKKWPITKSAPRFTCHGFHDHDCGREFCGDCAKNMPKPPTCSACGCIPHELPARNVYDDDYEAGLCSCDCKAEMEHDVFCLVCQNINKDKKPEDKEVIAFLLKQSKEFGSRKEVEAAITKKRKEMASSSQTTKKSKRQRAV